MGPKITTTTNKIKKNAITIKNGVKNHFKNHKSEYIIGSIAVVSTAAVGYAGYRSGYQLGHTRGLILGTPPALQASDDAVLVAPSNLIVAGRDIIEPTINIVTVVHRDGRGHPGYIVQCLETGEIFLSQGDAANAAGVSPTTMGKHLNGHTDHIYGQHFVRLTAHDLAA